MVSIVISSTSVLVAMVSALFSFRSSRTARRGLVAGHLIASLGDMIASLQAISSAADKLDNDSLIKQSRRYLQDHFDSFQSADSRVGLLVSSVGKDDGTWVRMAANNIAADLLQAEELVEPSFDLDNEDITGYTDQETEVLRRSRSYQSAIALDHDVEGAKNAPKLGPWWAKKVLQASGYNFSNVYSVEAFVYDAAHALTGRFYARVSRAVG